MHRFIVLLTAVMIALGIGGCGGGGTSADPLGTDSLMFGDTAGSGAIRVNPNLTAVDLTATVTSASGKAVAGREVSFWLVRNESGAVLSPAKVITSATGKATTRYMSGIVDGVDVVRASISNDATMDVYITVGTGGAGGLMMTATATPASLIPGAMSVIVAQVSNADGTPAFDKPVSFAFVQNNSLAPPLTIVNSKTDANGTAIAVYTAGSNDANSTREDTVKASVTGSAVPIIITRLPATGTGNRIVSFSETPETDLVLSGRLDPTSNVVIMKVRVTEDNLTSPVVGEKVTFSIVVGGGTITDPSGTTIVPTNATLIDVLTDRNGEAWVLFTRPGPGPGETVVRATISATTNGGDAARIVYW